MLKFQFCQRDFKLLFTCLGFFVDIKISASVLVLLIRFADDVIEAPDGSLYFSIASTKFGLHDWYFDVLEAKPHGQLLKYDPALNETSIVLDGLCFANGVALSVDQDYLVVCETWK